MKKTLYLHIGTNKAGSSAIQEFLVKHAPNLEQLGYLYPNTGRISNAHYQISGSLKIGVNPPKNGEKLSRQKAYRRLSAEVRDSNCPNVIISSEYFILCRNPDKVKNFFRDYEPVIVVYLRRHDEWLESLYNQGVKTSPLDPKWGRTIEAFIDYVLNKKHQEFDFLKLLQPWAKTFGTQRIVVRPLETRQLAGGHVCSDFLDVINLTGSASFELPTHKTNVSLDNDTVRLLDIIARTQISEMARKQLFSWLIAYQLRNRASINQTVPRQSLLSPEQRQHLIDQNADSYSQVARIFLDRPDGRLFHSDAPDLNEAWQAYTGPDAASMIEYTGIIFDHLIRELAVLKADIAKLQKKDD